MDLDLSVGSLIRSSSGVLLIAVGALAFGLARRSEAWKRAGQALALYCTTLGVAFVIVNLHPLSNPTPLRPFVVAAILILRASAVAGMGWLLVALRPPASRRRWLFLAAFAGVATWAGRSIDDAARAVDAFEAWNFTADLLGASNVIALVVLVELACRVADAGGLQPGHVPFAIGLGVYPAYWFGDGMGIPTIETAWEGWAFASLFALLLAVSVAWIRAAHRSGERGPVAVSLTILAFALAGMLIAANVPDDENNNDQGQIGVIRILGATMLAFALLRSDFLRAQLTMRSVRRGTVATAALASLFIVAQVMQNFLSAEYGLLTGGAIAGAVLFAASPVQRAFERMGEKRPAGSRGRPSPHASKEQESAYRDAVRLALRDRRFEAEEELMLANLADRLGLTAMRAIEIRLAVEKERGLR